MAEDVKLNLRAINAIMTSAPAQAIVDSIGREMAAAAGDGFVYVARPHPHTARGYVQTGSARARRQQAKDAALERALGQVQR
ncbi:hypothetical protein IFU40_06095 [Microbacterium sp. CFBP 13617]|uniref:hypothetical protein n=1 Tax=Microbacterium sp. CFBP 13617 TaxID=2774035 RepID=UPI0017848862|nr:hypothetical protein [Microbacterium sp. CFBP 13617]MBD8218203.1 hypothetical protein [Microbacterium sp. CFBP 13617]